jgi:hypothetical protein
MGNLTPLMNCHLLPHIGSLKDGVIGIEYHLPGIGSHNCPNQWCADSHRLIALDSFQYVAPSRDVRVTQLTTGHQVIPDKDPLGRGLGSAAPSSSVEHGLVPVSA